MLGVSAQVDAQVLVVGQGGRDDHSIEDHGSSTGLAARSPSGIGMAIGRGSRQTVYVLGADGTPQPVQIVVGESNGSETEVTAGDLREGQEVITARLEVVGGRFLG